MLRMRLNNLLILGFFVVIFMAGYWFGNHSETLATLEETQAEGALKTTSSSNQIERAKPDMAKLDKLIELSRQTKLKQTKMSPPPTSVFSSSAQSSLAQTAQDELPQIRPAEELLDAVDSLGKQFKNSVDIQNSDVYQQLLFLIKSDPNARKKLLDRFLATSGTPVGDALSLALALSRSNDGTELTEVTAAAQQLLSKGSAQQKLSALQLLNTSNKQDPKTRSMVLDILRQEGGSNVDLAQASLAALSSKGVASSSEHQEIIDTLLPLTQSKDSKIRQSSLQTLSRWAGNDASALNSFTQAVTDSDPEIRSLAISTLGNGNFAYENVRDTLLSVLQNPNEEESVRLAAQQSLESFPLDEQALNIYQTHAANQNAASTEEEAKIVFN